MLVGALLLYFPLTRLTALLVAGVVVFVVLMASDPAFWRRRLAKTCIITAISLSIAPRVSGFLDLGGHGRLAFDTGESLGLVAILGVLGVLFGLLDWLPAHGGLAFVVEKKKKKPDVKFW